MASKTQFLYVGQLEEHKGIRELFGSLKEFGSEIEVHIAGEGRLAEFVAAQAELDHRIHFHGFVSLNFLIKLLRSVDAVVVPSTCYENSPTVIYESSLVGVPVIASRIGGIPEIVIEGETGLLVRPADEQDLARAMRMVHDERDVWWTKSESIRAQATQYSIKHYVDRLEEFIEEMRQKKS